MKKMFQRMQDLRQKAGQLKTALDAAPGKVAELRRVVDETTGELRELGQEVRATAGALGIDVDQERRFARIMSEISESEAALLESGIRVQGFELERGMASSLTVSLERDVEATLDAAAIQARKDSLPTAVAELLASVVAAAELDALRAVPSMRIRRIEVRFGSTPRVRFGWSRAAAEAVGAADAGVVAPVVAAAPPVSGPGLIPGSLGVSSPVPADPDRVVVEVSESPPAAVEVAAATAGVGEAPVTGGRLAPGWRKDALARFKKMPDLSKWGG